MTPTPRERLESLRTYCKLQAEIDRLRAENDRARDLVRYARQFLHEEELISDQEYAELCADHGPERVARLQTYDKMRADLATERKRAEFWKAETGKRVVLLAGLEWAGADGCGDTVCPDCGWERRDPDEIKRMIADGIRIHDPDCDLARLMTMPEEPKP